MSSSLLTQINEYKQWCKKMHKKECDANSLKEYCSTVFKGE